MQYEMYNFYCCSGKGSVHRISLRPQDLSTYLEGFT